MRFISCGLMLIGSSSMLLQAMDAETTWTPFVSLGYAPSISNIAHTDFSDKGAGSLGVGAAMKHGYSGDWGYMVCAEAFDTYGKADGDTAGSSGLSVKTNDLGIKVGAGPTYTFMPDLNLALVPYVGMAWAHFDYSGGESDSDDNGIALVYGIKLALHYVLDHGFNVGVYGGVEGTTSRMDSKDGGGKYTATGAGPVAGLSFGWLF